LKCPVRDKSVKELLYNLGLDFEQKRMFNKALAVYEHILKAGNFKDMQQRIKKLKTISDTIVLAPGSASQDETLILENVTTKPTLGRYEILKELGQGASGTVYLGRDPKINREVAVKTVKYGEVDADQLEEVKKRFFREAEAAGKLSHPNIATIYDVGEDYDMAYIAMELIRGENLTRYCRKGKLLPVKRALTVVSQVAKALGYAHSRGVVHRDIKPANIMLLKNDHVKVTDFGIARVAASSKTSTQTGYVLGTPSYMSPEQVAGKKVGGRSDLFSLGVVFYELLSSEKPFKGDSIAALMYAITKASYTPLRKVAPDIPSCCVKIVDKLLAKGVTKRFKTADEVARQIQLCLEKLD
jgi:serine/threonine-protein kinase